MVSTACTGVKTTTSGLEDQAFLEFVGDTKKYNGKVEVIIGERQPFYAKVSKDSQTKQKGQVYAVPTGKHVVDVKFNGVQVYKKQVFVSAQETKRIMLP